MRAHEIMTTPVVTVGPDTPLRTVAEILVSHRISAVPVIDKANAVVGIISEGDLIHRRETRTERRHSWWLELFISDDVLAQEYVKSHGRTTEDVMSRHVLSVEPSASLVDVASLLNQRRIKRVPVIDDGKLVGIISRADLVRALVRMEPKSASPNQHSDADIQMALDTAIANERWTSALTLVSTVHDGIVQLRGIARSEAERLALGVLARNIPGVKRVDDQLQLKSFVDS